MVSVFYILGHSFLFRLFFLVMFKRVCFEISGVLKAFRANFTIVNFIPDMLQFYVLCEIPFLRVRSVWTHCTFKRY